MTRDAGDEVDEPTTANHEFFTPEVGATDWHLPLNANWEALDASVEIRDREENRDQYEPKEGAKFFATDTGAVYVGDGEEGSDEEGDWLQVTSGGVEPTEVAAGTFTHTGGGSTALVLEDVSPDELAAIDVVVGLDSTPDFDGTYGFGYDWAKRWNDEDEHVDVLVTVNWQPDPGQGNDLQMHYAVRVR